jgi:hypothetical protein
MNTQNRVNAGEAAALPVQQPSGKAIMPVASNRWQSRTITSNIRKCFIEVLHHDADPSTWIVRRWKKILWFKKRISSDWFVNRQQAFAYAYDMKQEYGRHTKG